MVKDPIGLIVIAIMVIGAIVGVSLMVSNNNKKEVAGSSSSSRSAVQPPVVAPTPDIVSFAGEETEAPSAVPASTMVPVLSDVPSDTVSFRPSTTTSDVPSDTVSFRPSTTTSDVPSDVTTFTPSISDVPSSPPSALSLSPFFIPFAPSLTFIMKNGSVRNLQYDEYN